MAVRIPRIIDETIERNQDYAGAVLDGLRALRDEIAGDEAMQMFTLPAPDYDLWRSRFVIHDGGTWLNTEWFFAEMLAYRRMMEAVRYWATLRDPFLPFKEEELRSAALWSLLEEALSASGSLMERSIRALHFTLWGNRIDLSMSNVAAKGTTALAEHLLVDDAESAVEALFRNPPGTVHLIMDNAGTEQAADFALVDLLLRESMATDLMLHVKMHPVLVSDVIVEDVVRMLEAMRGRGGNAAALAGRLIDYIAVGTLRVVPDLFWNSDSRLRELPPGLYRSFSSAALVIGKGDVNYRRVTNDALWPHDATLAEAADDFPARLILLRTLKSDTLVGVPAATQQRLDASEPEWRTGGTYGVIQYCEPPKS